MRNFPVSCQLFQSSETTSEIIDCRDAFDLTVSAYTSGDTTSVLTYQVSNWTGRIGNPRDGSIPEASWSNWTNFTPSAATVLNPILGVSYARMLKGPTGTFVVEYTKTVNG